MIDTDRIISNVGSHCYKRWEEEGKTHYDELSDMRKRHTGQEDHGTPTPISRTRFVHDFVAVRYAAYLAARFQSKAVNVGHVDSLMNLGELVSA